MSKKKIILALVIIAVLAGVYYAWSTGMIGM